MSADHPQITQCKQCHELRGVLGQSLVAHLVESELALDDSERVLHLGPHTGFELLSLIEQFPPQARASADAEETAAKAADGLTTEKKAQIEAIRESAKQKDQDARKTKILAGREEQLAKSVDGTLAALERKNAAMERLNAATEKAIELENKRLNRDSQWFSIDPATGQRVNMQIDS